VRAAVEAVDVAEVPSLFEVALDEAHVALKARLGVKGRARC
jgi:hypothetical protein